MAATPDPFTAPSRDECSMATLAHVLQVVAAWIAPLVIFLIKRDSRFVRFHALQALLLQIVYLAFAIIFVVGWFSMFFGVMIHQGTNPHAPPPAGLFLFFPLFWGVWMLMWVGMLVLAIVYAIKANRGEWADYPVLGRLARHILHL